MPETYDLIVRGGEVINHAGRGPADVGMKAGKIAALGDLSQASADARPGRMAALVGTELDVAARVCEGSRDVWIANDNAPGQVVIGPATYDRVKDLFVCTPMEPRKLKGKGAAIRPFLVDAPTQPDPPAVVVLTTSLGVTATLLATVVRDGPARVWDLRTGEQKWTFNMVPQEGEFGFETWPGGTDHGKFGGVHNWSESTVDEKLGLVFIPTDTPFWEAAIGHPINLFANNMVATSDNSVTAVNTLSNPFPNGLIQSPQRDASYSERLLGLSVRGPFRDDPFGYTAQWNFAVQREVGGIADDVGPFLAALLRTSGDDEVSRDSPR